MKKASHNWVKKALALLPFVGGVLVVIYMVKTKPTLAQEPQDVVAPLVEAQTVQLIDSPTIISAQGVVQASRKLTIVAEVGGKVSWQHEMLIPGARIPKDTKLLRINAREYQLGVEQARASVESQKLALAQETARQEVSAWEWKTYQERKGTRSPLREAVPQQTTKKNTQPAQQEVQSRPQSDQLALRKPHLKSAQANVKSAQSGLAQARLKLGRTQISSPFNAMVISESIELGQVVNPGNVLLSLVGTDSFRIQASIPVSKLRHLHLPSAKTKGSVVTITSGDNSKSRSGHLLQILGDLDSSGQMARILIEVEDPLELKNTSPNRGFDALLLGAYVDLAIEGPTLENVVELPRGAINDALQVWVVDSEGRIARRTIEVVWRATSSLFITGLKNGEQVVLSTMLAPQMGMLVRVVGKK